MVTAFLLVAGAALAAWGLYSHVCAKRLESQCETRMNAAADELRRMTKRSHEQELDISDYKHLCACANRMRWSIEEWRPTCAESAQMDNPFGQYFVVGRGLRGDSPQIVVKVFAYSIGDPDNRDFARLEAEELLDKLNER